MDRIRPVVLLLGVSSEGFDSAATDIDRLTEWLTSNLKQWASAELLRAARRSRDDHAMGVEAWYALGEIAQLPAWNTALAELGDRYGTVKNHAVDDQTAAHIEAATSLLRCFARHAAIEAGEPNLFHELEVATRNFEPDDDWSAQWWEVPFTAVMHGLCAAYAEIPGVPHRLEILEESENVDQLRAALEVGGVATDADPFEIARRNRERLANVL